MKNIQRLICASLLALAAHAHAHVEWLSPGANDLRAERLESDVRSLAPSAHREARPVNYAWSPDRAQRGRPFQSGPTPLESPYPRSTSQGYWVDATGGDLARGVNLPISAPGAVIRVSALEAGSRVALSPEAIELSIDGRRVDAEFGVDGIASGSDMRQQGMSVPEASLAFQLSRESQAGMLTMAHRGLPAEQALVIHVHEPESPWIAQLGLPRQNMLSGERLAFDLSLGDGGQRLRPASVQAVLVSPDASQSWPLSVDRSGQLVLESAPLAARASIGAGLYEAHVYTEAQIKGLTVRRDLTLALNIAPAIARFSGSARDSQKDGLSLTLGVEASAAGRYQVNAEIFGTDARGQLRPAAFVQSAAVLAAGQGQIQLDIGQDLLASSGLGAPYEVRNLMLLDQGRMYLLEQRERALRIMR
jgi:hypothetical protein